ncbi:TetR/AcrR family transcriptional regulator [Kineococcus gypseus]|uniref:TetR/AcrR family transcriptional regulator n=1 Tax=Kineococcus gypseus TaxID=1637102 RepID=UPI003D7EAB13
MHRPTREQIDEEILDTAAALFARHGVEHTSVQRVADATGYSKTGLLHRFPTKEALAEAALARTLAHVRRLAGEATATAPGPARDRALVASLADLALARPGFTSLALSSVSGGAHAHTAQLQELAGVLFEAFAAGPGAGAERTVRLTAALGGLATAALACRGELPAEVVHPLLVATAVDALGHRADAPPPTGAGPGA